MFLASSNVVRELMCSELHSRIFISLAGAYFFLMTRSLCTISLIYFSVFEYCCVLIELKFHLLSPVLTHNELLYNKKWSSLGNTLLRACSTNQVITVWQNHFCQMDSVAPVLEVAFWVNVSCICVGQTCKPYLNSSSFLPLLSVSLSFSYSLTHSHKHTCSTRPCLEPFRSSGGELVNSRWTRYGKDFPLAPLLSHTAHAYCA